MAAVRQHVDVAVAWQLKRAGVCNQHCSAAQLWQGAGGLPVPPVLANAEGALLWLPPRGRSRRCSLASVYCVVSAEAIVGGGRAELVLIVAKLSRRSWVRKINTNPCKSSCKRYKRYKRLMYIYVSILQYRYVHPYVPIYTMYIHIYIIYLYICIYT